MAYEPHYYTLVSGCGKSKFPLVAFDNALRNAGIADYNLVKVSSILPPNCIFCDTIPICKGSILFAAYSTITVCADEKGETAVATAIPNSDKENGVIFENSAKGDFYSVEDAVKEMCIEAMNNRQKDIKDIRFSSQKIVGEKDYFISSISAVVMW